MFISTVSVWTDFNWLFCWKKMYCSSYLHKFSSIVLIGLSIPMTVEVNHSKLITKFVSYIPVKQILVHNLVFLYQKLFEIGTNAQYKYTACNSSVTNILTQFHGTWTWYSIQPCILTNMHAVLDNTSTYDCERIQGNLCV